LVDGWLDASVTLFSSKEVANSNWTVFGDVVLSGGSLQLVNTSLNAKTSVVIESRSTLVTSNSVIDVSGDFTVDMTGTVQMDVPEGLLPIVVRGCANLNGTLVIALSTSQFEASNDSQVYVLDYVCLQGTFSSISAVVWDSPCSVVNVTDADYGTSALTVSLRFEEIHCKEGEEVELDDEGLSQTGLIGVILIAVFVPGSYLICLMFYLMRRKKKSPALPERVPS
jgi:hypothetical protein